MYRTGDLVRLAARTARSSSSAGSTIRSSSAASASSWERSKRPWRSIRPCGRRSRPCARTVPRARGSWPTWCRRATIRTSRLSFQGSCARACPAPWCPRRSSILDGAPALAQRQGGPPGLAGAGALAARWRSAAPRNAAEERLAGIWARGAGPGARGHPRRLLRPGRPFAARHAGGAPRGARRSGWRCRCATLFQAPTVAGLAERLEALPPRGADGGGGIHPCGAASRVRTRSPSPSSGSGSSIGWSPGSAAYNVRLALRLTGPLDETRLAASLGEVVRRHEPLRTVYREEAGEPVQVVLPGGGPVPLERTRAGRDGGPRRGALRGGDGRSISSGDRSRASS